MQHRNGERTGSGGAGWLVALIGVAGVLGSCASPFGQRDDTTNSLRRSIAQAAGREMVEAQLWPGPIALTRENRVEALGLKPEVMAELERMAGPRALAAAPAPLGPSLLTKDARVAPVTLERAIRSSVNNNLDVQFARLSPAISEAKLVAAQAAFDWVFFNNLQWNSTDEPIASQSTSPLGTRQTTNQQQAVQDTVGLRRRLTTGGQFTIQHQATFTNVDTPNLFVIPDPNYQANLSLQLDQPLLRNFGSDAALAQVRLARNADRNDIQELKSKLIKNVTETEAAYWDLLRQQYDVKIFQRLLDQGEEVRQKLQKRRQFDVKDSTYSDAVSKVQQRKAQVIQAQRNLVVASTRLKQLMNDPEFTVGSEVVLVPADEAVDAPVEFSLADALLLALANRPEVQRSILSIDDTSIRLQLAENGRLPLLDLQVLTRFSGLGSNPGRAYNGMVDDGFVDFVAGLRFEQPLGYREGGANARVRRFEQSQAVIAYRNTVQGIVAELKNALIDVVINYILIEQTRDARLAATENLRTLEVEEQNIAAPTSEFLNLKLQRQQELAQAERSEIDALATYNTGLAKLYAAMGTCLERNRIKFEVPDAAQRAPTSPLYPAYPTP